MQTISQDVRDGRPGGGPQWDWNLSDRQRDHPPFLPDLGLHVSRRLVTRTSGQRLRVRVALPRPAGVSADAPHHLPPQAEEHHLLLLPCARLQQRGRELFHQHGNLQHHISEVHHLFALRLRGGVRRGLAPAHHHARLPPACTQTTDKRARTETAEAQLLLLWHNNTKPSPAARRASTLRACTLRSRWSSGSGGIDDTPLQMCWRKSHERPNPSEPYSNKTRNLQQKVQGISPVWFWKPSCHVIEQVPLFECEALCSMSWSIISVDQCTESALK